VLHGLLADVHARLRRRGIATFGGLLRGARDLLRNPEVCARVRADLDQLLVDEFQDTDALQCEILEALAGGAGPGPTLFLVGDPKQSIYGWRNADLRAYEAIRRPLDAAGRVEPLVVNFRSVPAILAEVARAVGPVMEETPNIQPAFEPLVACAANEGRDGYTEGGRAAVEHWLPARYDVATGEIDDGGPAEQRAEREARAVAHDLAALRDAGVPLERVAILLRVTAAFEPVLVALREAGLPYLVERETDFYQRREIVDAVALVRCVLDPLDHLALVATLRSSVVGVPDAALLPLWRVAFQTHAGAIDGADEACREARWPCAGPPPRCRPKPEAQALTGWPEALDDSPVRPTSCAALRARDLRALRRALRACCSRRARRRGTSASTRPRTWIASSATWCSRSTRPRAPPPRSWPSCAARARWRASTARAGRVPRRATP
jgi:hypothetical protein